MRITPILEFGEYSPGDDYDSGSDPELIAAVDEHFANVYSVFEDMDELPDVWVSALDKLDEILAAKKGRGDSTEDYYIDPDMVPKLKQAVASNKVQQAFRWIIQNARTAAEIIESGEMDDVMNELGSNRQEAEAERRDPYGYRGVSKSDFI